LAKSREDSDYADTAWFAGFAPCLAPEIIVVALFESGEHGDLAAPIVRDVLKAYFDKKERLDLTRQAPAEQSLAAARPPSSASQGPQGRSVR
jgi:hypothetical protein